MAEVGESPVAGEQFGYRGEVFLNPRVTRQWVSIKVFSLPAEVTDQAALGLMIADVRYRDSYAGTGDKDMVVIHGPYRLEAITPARFTVADPGDVQTLLATWAQYYVPWPQVDLEAMDRELYHRLTAATTLYGLPDLRATAQHDWGEVVGGDGFHEFIAINRAVGELALIVASDD